MKDDTISRQAAIEAIADTLKYEDYGFLSDELESVINNVPAADVVERKKGKWLKAYGDHEAFGVRPFYRYCSECNESTVWEYNYCPHCGARMER